MELIPDDLLLLAEPAEVEAYEKLLKAELALSSPLQFALHVSEGIAQPYPHILLLDAWITALVEGRLYKDGPGPLPVQGEDGRWYHPERGDPAIYKLTISMPPRHGKSFLVSDHLPAWFLCKYPDLLVMLASYEADFAASWGRKARTHVEEYGKDFGVSVDPETRSGARWYLKGNRGGMVTAGAGGPLTGKGGHLKIIDDPIKNAEEALSATQRQNIDDWYQSTFATRSQMFPDGTPAREILMNTRWHEDDLNGRVMDREPEKWAHLNLPAMAEPVEGTPDPLDREGGEPLCPELVSLAMLQDFKSGSDSYWWAAMYQGRPNIEGGGLLSKPYRYHRLILPEGGGPGTYEATDFNGKVTYIKETACYRFATMDVAGSVKTSADWTVFSVWDISPDGLLMLHARHKVRMETPDHEEVLREWYDLYPRMKFVGIENKTFGQSLIKGVVRHGGIIVRPLEPDTDKVARAIPYGALIKTGRVSFPVDAPWLYDWEHEHLQFPNGTHDDQVDTGSYAAMILDLMPSKKPPKQEPQTYDEKVQAHVKAKVRAGQKKRRIVPTLGRWG